MVGRSTRRELARMGIQTIGEIARTDPELLRARFGKGRYRTVAVCERYGRFACAQGRRGRAAAVDRQQRHPRAQHRKRVSGASNHAAACRKRCFAPAQAKSALPDGRGRALRSEQLQWKTHRMRLRYATDITSELAEHGMELLRQSHSFVVAAAVWACAALSLCMPMRMSKWTCS